MQSAGCFATLKSVQANPETAVEFLDFSVSESFPFISHISVSLLVLRISNFSFS